MSNKIEESLGIANLTRNEVERISKTELQRIKIISDENLNIIKTYKKPTTEETNRNIIVNLIASLDYYIHEIILWGLIVITQDKFQKGKNYDKFMVSIKFIKNAIESTDENEIVDKTILRNEIIELLKKPPHTYQKWDKIRDGLKYILPKSIDEKIGKLTTSPTLFKKQDLTNLNTIRNNIVHNFDRNYDGQPPRNDCNRDIDKDIALIELIIDSIQTILIDYEESESTK